MKKIMLVIVLFAGYNLANAQNDDQTDTTKTKKKAKFGETMQQLPDMLIAPGDKAVDSSMYFLKNDNLTISVNPMWQDKGTQISNDLRLNKINEDPLDATFPLQSKRLCNGLTITMETVKKPMDYKKQQIIASIKAHLLALYKAAGRAISSDQVTQQVNDAVKGPFKFTTKEGKEGDLYQIDDFQPQQSGYLVIWMMPGAKPGTTVFVQFNYYKFEYDEVPDDISDLKVFQYPDDLLTYMDFTKKMLKTLKIE
jgi:hypothetical protein